MTAEKKPVAADGHGELQPQDRPRFADAQALEHWFETRIARELERCRVFMSKADWNEHHDWIEANARASLLEALRARADRGEL
ncbi:hypothetical protein BC1002_3007 [Paraburkholderia atlantica]|uniref:Uncharacterized protein n=1 Tax=Paraburkholderia atlantica TaxID=2654982 RepID=D5W6D1_PARAM|nr:hypothetical protein [Paraburkholderia atlantica]ADG17052.1 hypothetical protein BC1002_3007 [Paraburkholderia atlantica]